ncbi:hypothetical protein GCM10023093_16050 [Nemorincola caseinilytica]|uniref:Uncharacterized protein n=2 Tax=Nemorincola caseinilytica TaxID=2054315 RepID=A0ABP8NGD4_9BACT
MPARMPGTWQAQPIKIDGDCTDWPSPYPNYDAKAMVAYATSNDAENLYVTIQTGDPLTQIKILKQGMAVMIDTGGRKDASFVINYPLQNPDDLSELFAQNKDGGTSSHLSRQFDQKLQKSAEGCNQYSLDGFGPCNGGYMVSQSAPCGVRVTLRIDEYKQLVWEAVVPFKAILNKSNISAADAGKAISVCYAIKAFKAPSTKADNAATPMNNNMGGQTGMPGGRMNSMQMNSPGTVRASGGPNGHLYESTKTWKHFGLAWGK